MGYAVVVAWLCAAVFCGGDAGFMVCPSKWVYHIPCPGCGITRAVVLFSGGRWVDAVALNPNVVLPVLLLPVVPLVLFHDLFARDRWLPLVCSRIESLLHRKCVLMTVLAVELAIWVANVVRGI